jgi:hypothetical protein
VWRRVDDLAIGQHSSGVTVRTLNAADRYSGGVNPPECRHQAGASLSGPIKKDKVFYFAIKKSPHAPRLSRQRFVTLESRPANQLREVALAGRPHTAKVPVPEPIFQLGATGAMPAGQGIVEGGEIPHTPVASAK